MFQRILEIVAAFCSRPLPCGTTITARRSARTLAKVTLWPELPRFAAITPATSGDLEDRFDLDRDVLWQTANPDR